MVRIQTATDIELEVSITGKPGAPVIVLLHGFPETAYSWRHQIAPLVAAGYRVLVPNQRGYGASSVPGDVTAYAARHLTADIAALLDSLDVEQADIVGHDWGALVAWHMGYFFPQRCRSIIAASVPFAVPGGPPAERFALSHGDRFFYINYFQTPGLAEKELEADPERFLRAIWWATSAAAGGYSTLSSKLAAQGTTACEAFETAVGGRRPDLPTWLNDSDLQHYLKQFQHSGFFGPVSWYRNFDRNYFDTCDLTLDCFSMPTAFIAGSLDPVIADHRFVNNQNKLLPNFKGSTLLAGVGHWVQQEAPDNFNRCLLKTLISLR
ncbi:MAG: alpha/beta fold hydrolase [Parahaliea sp.]